MPLEVPESLSSIRALVELITQHVRPASTAEENAAINFGYKKATRALASVRNQAFQAFVDPFTLSANTTEYDIGVYDPPVWKPHRLLVGAPGGTVRTIFFQYAALTSQEFQERETGAASVFSTLLYDVLVGQLAGTTVAITATNFPTLPSTITVAVANVGQFQNGTAVRIPLVGPVVTYGTETMAGTYLGVVTNVNTGTGLIELQPNLTATPATLSVTPLRRRVLKIVPPLSDSVSGRLWYQYRPGVLVNDTDLLDPFIAEHRDMVVYYAAAQLLRAVNDGDAQRWFEMAQEMRSEMLQDGDPLAGQNSEALGSGLPWGDW